MIVFRGMYMFDFVSLDFETANSNFNSACSVGIVAVENNSIVKEDYFLIKPPTHHFGKVNTQIHGMTYESVKNAKTFSEIFPAISAYIESTRIVAAHNANFDMNVLNECIEYYHLPKPNFVYIDTMNFPSPVKHESRNSLIDCANYFGIDIPSHHNPLCDAEVCAKIVIESIKRSDANTLAEYVLYYPEVNRQYFSDLPLRYSFYSGKMQTHAKSHIYVSPSSVTTANTVFNESHPLYKKICVLTGELESLSRRDAMQKIMDVGGIVRSSVSSKTDYLIVGDQDKEIVGEDGLSTKQEKAYSLISSGKNIKIINEDEFLKLLSGLEE